MSETHDGHVDTLMVASLTRQLLVALGEDPTRPGLKDTPMRVARAWAEMLDPGDESKITTTFPGEDDYGEMIVVRGIHAVSYCEHHMMPFTISADVAYVPEEKIIGLSKIPRLVKWYASRLQLQERLTVQIADDLMERIGAKGTAVKIVGKHTCMSHRGVKAHSADMVTSCLRGVLLTVPEARSEFFHLVS